LPEERGEDLQSDLHGEKESWEKGKNLQGKQAGWQDNGGGGEKLGNNMTESKSYEFEDPGATDRDSSGEKWLSSRQAQPYLKDTVRRSSRVEIAVSKETSKRGLHREVKLRRSCSTRTHEKKHSSWERGANKKKLYETPQGGGGGGGVWRGELSDGEK